MNTTINFANGPDNDTVLTQVFDAASNLVFSITDKTWENYYRQNGRLVTGADSIQFQSRGSVAGASNGVYVDDVTLGTLEAPAAAPLPGTALSGLALLGLLGVCRFGRARLARA